MSSTSTLVSGALLLAMSSGGVAPSLRVWAMQPPPAPALDNAYVRITRNDAPCAAGAAGDCGDRVVVALGAVTMTTVTGMKRTLSRGDIEVAGAGQRYSVPTGGPFVEVAFKPGHPPVKGPKERIPPEKNTIVYDGPRFFVFEEKLEPGDSRAKHSHAQRVVVTLNETTLEQDQFGEVEPHVVKPQVPDRVGFNEPVVHNATNVGRQPLRNIVIELKPDDGGR
ncbi:MAG: hypothetical protein U0Q12_19935 [Vicinamibacterales bacterium]